MIIGRLWLHDAFPLYCVFGTVYHPALRLHVEAQCPTTAAGDTTERVEFNIRLHGGKGEHDCLGALDANEYGGYPLETVCTLCDGLGMTGEQLASTLDMLCDRFSTPADFWTCNCGDYFNYAMGKFGLSLPQCWRCRNVTWDCGVYANELRDERCRLDKP